MTAKSVCYLFKAVLFLIITLVRKFRILQIRRIDLPKFEIDFDTYICSRVQLYVLTTIDKTLNRIF